MNDLCAERGRRSRGSLRRRSATISTTRRRRSYEAGHKPKWLVVIDDIDHGGAAAMRLLEAGIDTTVIALWLGHERVDTTAIYLHAHLDIKEKALAATTPPTITPGRYRPPDHLLAFLEGL